MPKRIRTARRGPQPGVPTKKILVALPLTQLDWLNDLGRAMQVSRVAIIRAAVEDYRKKLDPLAAQPAPEKTHA